MKKQYFVILGALALVAAFLVARYAYKEKRAEQIDTMAKTVDSPLTRAYAQSMGPADAKVVIVEFFDPGCETCRVFAAFVKELVAANPDKIRLVMRYAPFHHGADTIVQILEAGRLQGKYWETLQVMFDTQDQWANHHNPQPNLIWQFLPSVGLDLDRLRRDMNDPSVLNIVQQDIEDANTLGVHKTPTFFVNGKPLPSFGYEQLKALVDAELAAQYGR